MNIPYLLASLLVTLVVGHDHAPPDIIENPSPYVTRAEAVTSLLLSRDPSIPAVKNHGQFSDIRPGTWYESYMLAAEKFGIISANPVGSTLRPDKLVTRAEFLKMLTLTFHQPTRLPHDFADVPPTSWMAPYAGLAQQYHLFTTADPHRLDPSRVLNENEAFEAIKILQRVSAEREDADAEQQLAAVQATQKLTLYTIISTRRTNVVFSDTPPPSASAASQAAFPSPAGLAQVRTRIVTLVNGARAEAGLRPLIYNAPLELSAQTYAERMSGEGFFGHTAPDGQTLKDRIQATGYYTRSLSHDCNCFKGFALGENLARGQKTADEAFRDWMQSPAHRSAILNADYSDIGIGESAGIWVQHFGGMLLPSQTIASGKN